MASYEEPSDDQLLADSLSSSYNEVRPRNRFYVRRDKTFYRPIDLFAIWTTMHCGRSGGHVGRPPQQLVVKTYEP